MIDIVRALFLRYEDVRSFLIEKGEPTFAAEVETLAPKVLLLASASYFESAIVDVIRQYFRDRMGDSDAGVAFVYQKALSRQYHTLFDWDGSNVNRFWSWFGADFKKYADDLVKADEGLSEDAKAFLEIGRMRNQLVHQNYLAYSLDKTSSEIYDLAVRADRFVQRIPGVLNGFAAAPG